MVTSADSCGVTDHAGQTWPLTLERSPPVTCQETHGWNETGHGRS